MNPEKKPISSIDKVISPLTSEHPQQTGLVLLDNNLDAFALRAVTAQGAGHSLDLQYYIWHNDLTGKLLGYELLRAADRGVKIRLLLDDMNISGRDTILSALEQHPNIEIKIFNPIYTRKNTFIKIIELAFRGISLNRRMHNKAWIVDGRIAIVGGRNIGNEYFDASPRANFFDVDVLLMGNAVLEVESIFNSFWDSNASVPLAKLVKLEADGLTNLREHVRNIDCNAIKQTNVYLDHVKKSPSLYALFHGDRPIYWAINAHVYSDPPDKTYKLSKEKWLINIIYPLWRKAQQEIKMVSPYFVPGKEGVKMLTKLCHRGVKVNILTNSLAATDVLLVHSGYAHYRVPLLKSNVQLYELMPFDKVKKKLLGSGGASLHTKMFMVDNEVSFIGSFNLDPRSVRLNTEMGILFEQQDISLLLQQLFSRKALPDTSYQLFLEEGHLKWRDASVTPSRVWTHDPFSGVVRRAIVKIASWLPLESQL